MSAYPRPEAVAAAGWWASKLGRAAHDIGDRTPDEREKSGFAFLAGGIAGRAFTDEQREAFRQELAIGIEEHLRKWETRPFEGSWRPDNPQWNAANRAFGCDYHPEPVLADAAERAGFKLKSTDLPMKTSMQVNPGIVRVGEGYGASYVEIWKAS